MKITRAEYFKRNHLTLVQSICVGLAILSGVYAYIERDMSNLWGVAFMAAVIVVIQWQGRKAYTRYAK